MQTHAGSTAVKPPFESLVSIPCLSTRMRASSSAIMAVSGSSRLSSGCCCDCCSSAAVGMLFCARSLAISHSCSSFWVSAVCSCEMSSRKCASRSAAASSCTSTFAPLRITIASVRLNSSLARVSESSANCYMGVLRNQHLPRLRLERQPCALPSAARVYRPDAPRTDLAGARSRRRPSDLLLEPGVV